MNSPCKIIDNFFSSKQIAAFCLILFGFFTFHGHSQAIRDDYKAYIEQYRTTALQHQQMFGIPASITLAQGLLESRAGKSGLATNGNNHFGIKSYNWRGDVVCYGDSANMHCYRKYGAPEDSFLDHARFLKSKRYGKLYELDVTDYKAWAQGLRECGYAEDPAYPQKLINIIEQYHLHELDASLAGITTPATTTPAPAAKPAIDSKAQKLAQEKAAKEALKRAQKAERDRQKHEQELKKIEHEKQKKAAYEQQRLAREQERLAEKQLREKQRRERAERYAQRHSADAQQEKQLNPQATTRAIGSGRRTNARNTTAFNSSADND